MPLPSPFTTGKLPITGPGSGPIGSLGGGPPPVPPGSQRLQTFTMQDQLGDNWCWAATAASVSRFYNPASTWTQCSVANGTLKDPPKPAGVDCCSGTADDPPDECDKVHYLEDALGTTNNYVNHKLKVLDFPDIVALINAGSPVCVRVNYYASTKGHFLVLYGWKKDATGEEWVDVADPLYGTQDDHKYADFKTKYKNQTYWTHTYWTKR